MTICSSVLGTAHHNGEFLRGFARSQFQFEVFRANNFSFLCIPAAHEGKELADQGYTGFEKLRSFEQASSSEG
jgi:hypothetical protein